MARESTGDSSDIIRQRHRLTRTCKRPYSFALPSPRGAGLGSVTSRGRAPSRPAPRTSARARTAPDPDPRARATGRSPLTLDGHLRQGLHEHRRQRRQRSPSGSSRATTASASRCGCPPSKPPPAPRGPSNQCDVAQGHPRLEHVAALERSGRRGRPPARQHAAGPSARAARATRQASTRARCQRVASGRGDVVDGDHPALSRAARSRASRRSRTAPPLDGHGSSIRPRPRRAASGPSRTLRMTAPSGDRRRRPRRGADLQPRPRPRDARPRARPPSTCGWPTCR